MVEKTLSASEHTKQQLASALKILMAERPMDKITISDLTAICKIRRQSFYYHFEDIYDLLRWMFQNEAISLLQQHEGALRLLQLFRIEMLTHFYVTALAGMTESWLLDEIDRSPEQLINFADTILNGQLRGAALRIKK